MTTTQKRLTLQPPTQPLVVDRAGMPGNGVTETQPSVMALSD